MTLNRPLPGDARMSGWQDEHGVCVVAADLVAIGMEYIDRAKALLSEQAPHRLDGKCPACAAPMSQPCFDYEEVTTIERLRGMKLLGQDDVEAPVTRRRRIERVVPHESRTSSLMDRAAEIDKLRKARNL